jgi:hypothetical protein
MLLLGFERFLGHPAYGLLILMALPQVTLTTIRTSALTSSDSETGDNTLVAELVFFHFFVVVLSPFDIN